MSSVQGGVQEDFDNISVQEVLQRQKLYQSELKEQEAQDHRIKGLKSKIPIQIFNDETPMRVGQEKETVKGKLKQTLGFAATPSGIPSDALKKFHSQVLKKAEEALFTQPIDERDFSATVFPVQKKDIPWAKEELKRFRRGFIERLEQAPKKESVYCLSVQFFSLNQKPMEK